MIENFLNPQGHQNCITGSEVTAALVRGYTLPIGGVAQEGSAPAACAAGLLINELITEVYVE